MYCIAYSTKMIEQRHCCTLTIGAVLYSNQWRNQSFKHDVAPEASLRWDLGGPGPGKIFQTAAQHVKNMGLKEKDVAGAISNYRRKKIKL